MDNKIFSCHKICEGVVEGEVLTSKDDIMFYLVDPDTGRVIEKGHSLEGKSVSNKILIFPGGKGSSVVQSDGLYQLNMKGNLPKAMIIQNPETVLVASSIIMGIPMVDRICEDFYKTVKNGDIIKIDTNIEKVTIVRE